MKTLLVPGGAGFIGANFIHHTLREHAYRVVNLDLLTYAGNLERLKDVEDDDRYAFVRGDIRDRELLARLFAEHEIDAVVNFAAESYVDRSITDPELFLKTNVLGTQALLDAARKSWRLGSGGRGFRPGVRFLQVSAAEVYGDLGDAGRFTESSPLSPRSPYSASKAAADLVTQAYHETYGLPVNVVRSTITYGPYQFPEKLVPMLINNALSGTRVPVYGDGLQVRDWLYVEDHSHALDAVLQRGAPGQVYNVGGNSERTTLEVIRSVLSALHAEEDLIANVVDRAGHDRRVVLDSSRITAELGWSPTTTLESGIDKTIRWYRDHPEWVRGVTSGAYEEYYRLFYAGRTRS